MEEVRPGDSCDGLTLGVTTTAPDDLVESPATCEHIPKTFLPWHNALFSSLFYEPRWSLGYDGQMFDCLCNTLTQVDWDPRSLREGDVVGLLITASEGELIIFRNGSLVITQVAAIASGA